MESNVIFPELPTYFGVPSLAGALSLIVVVLLPILAGLFMRVNWSAWHKGLVLLGFAAVKAFLEAWVAAETDGVAFDFGNTAYSVVVQFVMAVVAYFGLLKNTSVQQKALAGGVVKGVARPRRVR